MAELGIGVKRLVVNLLSGCLLELVTLLWCGCSRADDNHDAYEAKHTERALGIKVQEFPEPQGTSTFDEVPPKQPKFVFGMTKQKASGTEPREWYDQRPRVVARSPDGSVIEGYCGHGKDPVLMPGHGFVSTEESRRHRYPDRFHPQDVFIGERVDGKLKPFLFFRDVGSQSSSPYHLSVDSKGHVHLMVADVFTGEGNRLKLYWIIGERDTGKWTGAWLVDKRSEFTSWATAWSVAWGDSVHLIWNWRGRGARGEICYVEWTPKRFGRKLHLHDRSGENLDVAVDPKTGRILLVFSNEEGVFVASRPAKGQWTKPARLEPHLTTEHTVSVEALGKSEFVVRVKHGTMSQFLVRPKE